MRIIVDSACELSEKIQKRIGCPVDSVPLTLQVDNKNYIDDGNINMDEYIKTMENSKGEVKTAAPSPYLFLEKFKKEGAVFAVTLSSHLSATYQNAVLAQKAYREEFGNKFIHVFDSLSASVGETLVAIKIGEFIKKNLSNGEIVAKTETFIQNMRTFFILEKYDNLVKNGRISPYVAKLASMLSIRPICAGEKGKIIMADKARGTKKAMQKLIDMIARETLDFENRILGIAHVKCPSKAEEFKEAITKRISFKDVFIVEASGLCSTYAERNGIVVAY